MFNRFNAYNSFNLSSTQSAVVEHEAETLLLAGAGTFSESTQNALDTLFSTIRTYAPVSGKMLVAPICGSSLTDARQSILYTNRTPVVGAMTNTNFVSGDYSESVGLTSSGNKALTTPIVQGDFTSAVSTMYTYCPNYSTTGNYKYVMGAFDAPTSGVEHLILGNFDSGQLGYVHAISELFRINTTRQSSGGYGGSCSTQNSQKIFKNGTLSATSTTTRTWTPTNPSNALCIFCAGGSTPSLNTSVVATVSIVIIITEGLSDDNMLALHNACSAFNTALGRA